MNKLEIITLKALRKIYGKLFGSKSSTYDRGITDPDKASELIYNLLASGKPCMIARYGSTEMFALTNYLGVTEKHNSAWKYIQGKQSAWWWEDNVKDQMTRWSGFFPSTEENLMRFGEMMLEDSKQLDILGSWLPDEQIMIKGLKLNLTKVTLLALEPYWSKNPWSRVLEGKKVLVIHPFASLIEQQYKEKRENLFDDKQVLPKFDLKTIKAVQSLGGDCEYSDWFEALDSMKKQMDATDYDIVLLGCGAYGFPLAAHAKRMGKQAVHLGGALQLLFGIRGKRWDNPDYGIQEFGKQNTYKTLFNYSWIYPSASYIPSKAKQVEGGCYW
jgi:hypothetical protein